MSQPWQPIPKESASRIPPGGPPRTLVGAGTLPPEPPGHAVPPAILEFVATGYASTPQRVLIPLAWAFATFTALLGAAVTADLAARSLFQSFGLIFLALVAVTWVPCFMPPMLRIRRLARNGYSRQDLLRWLDRPDTWPTAPVAIPIPWYRRPGLPVLWPLVPIVAQDIWIIRFPEINDTALLVQSGLVLLLTALAAGTSLTCPVIEPAGRLAQLRYWREGLFGRLLFSLVGPHPSRRIGPAPTSAV